MLQTVAGHGDVLHPAGFHAQRAVGDIGDDVYCGLAVIVCAKRLDAAHVQIVRRSPEDAGEVVVVHSIVCAGRWDVGKPVLSQYLRGDPLADALGVLSVCQEDGVGVDVRVDEAGRYGVPGRVDHSSRLGLRKVANDADLLALDTHVRAVSFLSRSVYDRSPSNENIQHSLLPP